MPTKTVTVDADVEIDMEDFTDQEVQQEYEARFGIPKVTLQTIYEEFCRRGDAPQVLREFLYERLGRILP